MAELAQPSPCAVNVKPMKEGSYNVSSGFGMRGGEYHRGIDLAGPNGTPIFAALEGVVRQAGAAAGFGNWIVIDSTTSSGLVSTVYGHMYDEGVRVKTGEVVKAGQHIADVGSNGQSSGPHLHFEVWQGGRLQNGRAVDPMPLLEGTKASKSMIVNVSAAITDCSVGAGLKEGMVPPEFVPWLRKAGTVCAGIGSPLLAAQLEAENGFRHGSAAPVSSTGAQGPAQFMPGTWQTWGRDHDGNGTVDVNSIGDAVVAQGHLMCANHGLTSGGVTAGALRGDAVDLALAAYNAGFGAVQDAGGMPFGGDYSTQTQPYVRKIRQRERAFATANWDGGGPLPRIADIAKEKDGTPYRWGGGNTDGPTRGGFDSPGLTAFAVYKATEGKVTLPRTVAKQWVAGQEVAPDQIQPGDLVFTEFDDKGRPGHVAIALGEGKVVHAADDAGMVRVDPQSPDAKVRRMS